jgi:hypothetical protein
MENLHTEMKIQALKVKEEFKQLYRGFM